MTMRIVSTLATGVAFCVIGAVAVSASPARWPGIIAGDTEWDPSTRHWDHHFHSHQRSRLTPHPAEVEGYGQAPILRARPHLRHPAHRPVWLGAASAPLRD